MFSVPAVAPATESTVGTETEKGADPATYASAAAEDEARQLLGENTATSSASTSTPLQEDAVLPPATKREAQEPAGGPAKKTSPTPEPERVERRRAQKGAASLRT